jgi:Smg protein
MKEKVVEILVYIMSEIHENKMLNEIDITDLETRGYTQSEISAAFSWLYDNLFLKEGTATLRSRSSKGSWRILHEAEKFVVSTECQGYLIQLRELGLLDDVDLENVIERAMMSGSEMLSLADLQGIVASVLLAKSGGNDGPIRPMFDSGDTVH